MAGIALVIGVIAYICYKKSKKNNEYYKQILSEQLKGNEDAQELFSSLRTNGKISDKRLRKLHRQLAESGDTNAMTWLAAITTDNTECFNWYLKAAQAGDTEAMKRLSLGYSEYTNNDTGLPCWGIDRQKELMWLKNAVNAGDYEAMNLLAVEYNYMGDRDSAIQLHESVIESVDASAIDKLKAYDGLGHIYGMMGLNDSSYRDKALHYYEMAVLYTDYKIPDSVVNNPNSEYCRLRDSLGSVAMSLAIMYLSIYREDKTKGNKIAGMFIYSEILYPDLKVDWAKDLSEFEYSFSSEQIREQTNAAWFLKYTLQ